VLDIEGLKFHLPFITETGEKRDWFTIQKQ